MSMVFARKYRPKNLEGVVGQTSIVRTLSNALTSNKLHHAYLFIGKFGTGKTSVSRILAASENCTISPGLHPCGKCDVCKNIFDGNHVDVAEIDAASNAGKVDQVRELKRSASYNPIDGAKTKYFIIDECHRMTPAAEESLLKLIEEPPPNVRFVLCTTELEQMRNTIISRCQIHEFKEIYWREIARHLELIVKMESLQCDQESLNLCAKLANGSLRNALQNLEKLSDYVGNEFLCIEKAQEVFGSVSELVFYDLMDQIIRQDGSPDATAGYKIIHNLIISGIGVNSIISGISEVLRYILICITTQGCGDMISVSKEASKRLMDQSKRARLSSVIDSLKRLTEVKESIEHGFSPQIALELWLLDSLLLFRVKGG